MPLPDNAKELIRSGALGHLVTTNPDGSPQVTCVWVAVDGEIRAKVHARELLEQLGSFALVAGGVRLVSFVSVRPPSPRPATYARGRRWDRSAQAGRCRAAGRS